LILGFFDNNETHNQTKYKYPYLGKVEDCLDYAKKNRITEIYSCLSPETNKYIYPLAEEAERNFIRFKFVPDFKDYIDLSFHVDLEEGIPVLSLHKEPLDDMTNRIKKRFFDILFSVFVIVFFLSWIIPILTILIKLDSKGPVLFKQNRTGKNNRNFICLKLRTLQVNDDADSLQVTRNDNRVTKLGHFLRKSNLDELPQFFNVLSGSMSIVGSRPHMLKHTEQYSGVYNKYMIRHYLKPGITGWAQINGYRGEIKEQDQLKKRVEYDIWYLENWDIWLDIKIIALTFFSTLIGDKNAF
jgi:putative colanic acid biosynthesis UDP-glucose lipid carrier transferase